MTSTALYIIDVKISSIIAHHLRLHPPHRGRLAQRYHQMYQRLRANLQKQNGSPFSKHKSNLIKIFVKAFPNTMSTTVQHFNLTKGQESTYIITGDIEAMWLRDSTNQFIPYIRMPNDCTHIPALTRGLLNTQAEFILIDVYTNAFKRYELSKLLRPSYLNDISETLIMGIPVDLCRKR